MTTELSTKWRFEQISEKLSIEKTTYYNRLKFLEIEPNKDSEGTYLSTEQMEVMEELSQHIRTNGEDEGISV